MTTAYCAHVRDEPGPLPARCARPPQHPGPHRADRQWSNLPTDEWANEHPGTNTEETAA